MTWTLAVPAGPADEFASRAKEALDALRDNTDSETSPQLAAHLDSKQPDAAVKAADSLVKALRKDADTPKGETGTVSAHLGGADSDAGSSISISVSYSPTAGAGGPIPTPVSSGENQA